MLAQCYSLDKDEQLASKWVEKAVTLGTYLPLNIRDFNNRSLAAQNRTEWMTKMYLDRISLNNPCDFPKEVIKQTSSSSSSSL
jgi:hypothetical protein